MKSQTKFCCHVITKCKKEKYSRHEKKKGIRNVKSGNTYKLPRGYVANKIDMLLIPHQFDKFIEH